MPLYFDLETVPTDAAMAAPYPADDRKPPANYKSEDAINGWRERDREKWLSERAKECALNPRLGRIVAAAVSSSHRQVAYTAEVEEGERGLLLNLWTNIEENNGEIITFNGLTFDVPYLLVRTIINGLPTPNLPTRTIRDWSRRYSFGPHYDVRGALTGFDNRTSGTLTDWCKAFGIECDDTTRGSDIYALYKAGDFTAIAKHAESDVALTRKLYERISPIMGGLEPSVRYAA